MNLLLFSIAEFSLGLGRNGYTATVTESWIIDFLFLSSVVSAIAFTAGFRIGQLTRDDRRR